MNRHQKKKRKHTTLTALHCSILPARIFKPSSTIRPAMMALVVAIAGMMFPAMAEKAGARRRVLTTPQTTEQKLETDRELSSLTFDVKTALHGHAKYMHPEIGSRSDKIHRRRLILSTS